MAQSEETARVYKTVSSKFLGHLHFHMRSERLQQIQYLIGVVSPAYESNGAMQDAKHSGRHC